MLLGEEKNAGKIKIEKNAVSETLVIPLYGRAYCSKKYPQDMKKAKSLPWMSKLILKLGLKMKMIQMVEILFR